MTTRGPIGKPTVKTLRADAGEGRRKLLDWVKPAGRLSLRERSGTTVKELERLIRQSEKAVSRQPFPPEADTLRVKQAGTPVLPANGVLPSSLHVFRRLVRVCLSGGD
jgi:hypothetical protein